MKRAHLVRNIEALDQRLNAQLAPFQKSSQDSIRSLQSISPWWLVGSGLLAGLITGRLGLHSAYAMGALGFKTQPLIHTVIKQWMGTTSE